MRGFKELVAFISHFPSFLDKTPLWRHKTLRCGSGTRLEADPKELEMPTPPRIASEAPHRNGEKENPGSRAAPHGPAAPFWWHSAAIWELHLEEAAAERQKPRAEGSSGWFGSPSLFPPRSSGRIWGRFPELPDTRRTAQLHVGTFYSPDALAHCFCSTAKALFIPNRSPSPSSCFFSLYQHPLFPHPSTTLLLSTFGIFSLLGACFLGRSQRTIHSDSLLFFFFFLPRSI